MSKKIGKCSYYRRKSKVWPWGYYIPPGAKINRKGLFVCGSEQEAINQLRRR